MCKSELYYCNVKCAGKSSMHKMLHNLWSQVLKWLFLDVYNIQCNWEQEYIKLLIRKRNERVQQMFQYDMHSPFNELH
jgi:hypothetical protein